MRFLMIFLSYLLNTFLCLVSLLIVFFIIIIITPAVFLITVTIDKNRDLYLFLTRFFVKMFFLLSFVNINKKIDLKKCKDIDFNRPVIYVITHMSLIDGLLLFLLPGKIKFMANEFYSKIPIFGLGMSMTGNISVKKDNDGSQLDIYYRSSEILDAGYPLAIFPEGTRTRNGIPGRFQNSAFMLAIEKKATIVPVVFDTWNFLRPKEFFVRDRDFVFEVLDPIYYGEFKNLKYKELSNIVRDIMIKRLVEVRDSKRKKKNYYRNFEPHLSLDDSLKNSLIKNK